MVRKNKLNERHYKPVAAKERSRRTYWKDGAWKSYRVTKTCQVCKGAIRPHERCFDTGGHIAINETAKYCTTCAYEKMPTTYGEAEVLKRSRNIGALGVRG